jgi:hypothetical protein
MRNATPSSLARFYFHTEASGWTEDRVVDFGVVANDAIARDYVVDMGAHDDWSGTIYQLRFDVSDERGLDDAAAGGSVIIDHIRVGSDDSWVAGPTWSFDADAEGWMKRHDSDELAVADGVLTLTISNPDSGIELHALDIAAASYSKLRMRVRNGLGEAGGQLFFTTSESSWSEANSVAFAMIEQDPAHREVVVDLTSVGSWTGTITNLRIDFGGAASGPVAIDWIALSN